MEDNRSFQGSSQSFPPGFRFHPTDQELIIHYLRKKLSTSATTETATSSLPPSLIADIDIYKFNPWELPEKAFFGEGEWFFFSPRDRKYPNGVRPNRAAACGYWKATGTDKPILAINGRHCLGVKKALVFYKGRPPKGFKTDWVMHEYRLLDQFNTSSMLHKQKGSMRLDDWVLCRVKHKGNILLPENSGRQESAAAEKQERNHFDLSDCHLMGYLLGSASQAEFASENSEIVRGGGGGGSFFFEGEQKPELNLVSSMLSSLKRKLSFGALDELMMMPSGKKERQIPAGEQLSPAESESDEQECLEFLL